MVKFQNSLIIFVLVFSIFSMTNGNECDCHCGFTNQPVCESMQSLRGIADTNAAKLIEWERYRPFVKRFSERWKKEIAEIVEMKLDEYIAKGKLYPKPENLLSKIEDGIQNDSVMISKPPEDGNDIVYNLLTKVEMVENRTTEVEEELKSERRVRRHLEQEVKETQSSLINLGDQLQNVTVPVDALMNQVEMVIFSSLENMNKTIYEEHLKTLYYKVDGVVYKNETKKLDERIEHVETELHDNDNSSIVSKLAQDIKSLEENLHLLNSSIGDTVVPRIKTLNNSIDVLIPRIETLEIDTVRKDAAEILEDKMINLLNSTELLKTSLADVWSDIQDIRNFEKKFQNFSEQWTKSLGEIHDQIEFLKNGSQINKLIVPSDEADETNEIFQVIGTDNIPPENETDYTEHSTWEPEIKPVIIVVNRSRISEEDNTEYEKYVTSDPEVTPIIVDRSRISGNDTNEDYITVLPEVTPTPQDGGRIYVGLDEDSMTCEKPNITDPHLLADFVTDSDGRKHLKFGCHPIGLYAVSYFPVPPRCEDGEWKGPFPSCNMLSNITTIESIAKELSSIYPSNYPCSAGSGQYPDPTNCSQFFKCAHGKVTVIPCPIGLIYSPTLKVCNYPRITFCSSVKSSIDQVLQTLIPPILIEPDIVDRPSSHLGTGSFGQLIVHPRSSFSFHCLYPENIWGYPKWNVTYTHSEINQRNLITKEEKNRVILTVTVATEEDSGIYKCLTPFGVQHAIEVLVKAVVCPAFTMEEEYEDVFYRPTPEGKIRIIGTRAEFQCEEGRKIFAQCMASGSWSRGLPSKEECTLEKRKPDGIWNCEPLDISKHPDLILERNNVEKVVTFKCAGGKRLIGNSFIRCRDDGKWSHTSLPKCKN